MSRTRTTKLDSRERHPVRARRWPTLSACLLLALTTLTPALAQDATALYLKGDGHPLASLTAEAPTSSSLQNLDPDRDAFPGLLIEKGGDLGETDPAKYQMWVTLPFGHDLDGILGLVFWSAARDFGVGQRGVVRAFLQTVRPAA